MLPVGRSVATRFRGRSRLGVDELSAAVRAGLPKTAEGGAMLAATEALEHLGFIWREGGNQDWEPGIPSLMDYFAGPAETAARQPAAASPARRPRKTHPPPADSPDASLPPPS